MNRELKSNIALREGIAPQVVTAGTVNGAVCDTRGFDSATLALAVGAIAGAGVVTAKIQEGDLSNGSDMADVAVADLQTGAFTALLTNTQQWVGYRGAKRYIRAVATYVSGTSVAVGATFVLGHAQTRPAT